MSVINHQYAGHRKTGPAGKIVGMKLWKLVFSITIVLVLLAWPRALAGRAQSVTQLSVQPPDSMLPVGNTVRVELLVTNGVNVNAFDVTVVYDPDVLGLTGWSFGDYLSNLAVVSQVNQPGTLRVAATQLARPPVSGDGVLLRLDFLAEAPGASPVEITEAEFASGTGTKTEPERLDGTVTVVTAATFTPTVTVTATPTRTSTPLPTATLIPTATATPRLGATATGSAPPTRPGLGDTPDLPGETDLVPGPETAYPGEVLPELETPAATQPAEAPTAVPPGEAEPAPESVGEDEPAAPPEAEQTVEGASWLEKLLWGALIGAGLAIGSMLLIIIRRNKRREQPKNEDLLL